MFGKPREPQKSEQPDLQDIRLSIPKPEPEITQQDTVLQNEPKLEEKSELVIAVEKISRIVSPYFIVIVGLSLYENNFLIGTILIVVGILSLFKVSTKDVAKFLEWLKNFLGLSKSNS
jgi:hypothetical protein